MTRDVISLHIDDLSQFARSLRAGLDHPPSHLEMLGQIARAAGYRNYQHLRAASTPAPKADGKRVERALRHFDGQGRLLRFPGRTQMQWLCLWPLWAHLPARQEMSEREISLRIDALSGFRDAAQLRRSMVEAGLLTRTADGSVYRRIEQAPPPEARALIAELGARG
ncbi:DUF2087 domain-containing protein [Salipiger sp. P9]|uniref:DUF2087 domain-containing protein n=1 Tax=Salipiger pentaromativorans TaxID=2943193 RepID=UPI002157A829|nr:DUF2087 domain-containing protein [Salipiger pentaromativorans]MCR8547346.1 DUF2087 domain-containing protein [Salipiger pentaromativorans]